jgi:uncharacterized protein
VWVYNGVSGSVVALTPGEWAATQDFLAGGTTFPALEILRDLTLARAIVKVDVDELALLEGRYRAGTRDASTFGLTVVTSMGCNFDCPYCYQVKPRAILDDETVALLLEVVDAKLPTLDRLRVTWFGGEPLLATQRLFELSEQLVRRADAAEVDYAADIVTNGYLLSRDVASRLRDHRVRSAQITLDGPPETHDRMRPLRNGRPTFEVILDNVVAAADLLEISVRVNVDASNAAASYELLDLLAARGLGGRVEVYAARVAAYDEGIGAPSETYGPQCFGLPGFADIATEFSARARALDLATAEVPQPVWAPCTAVRRNDLVVGANGELYKCWDSVGNHREVVGHLRSWRDPDDRVLKWLRYDPFADEGCRSCIALPVCMGGCAHHQMTQPGDAKCSTFRLTYREQVEAYAAAAEVGDVGARRPGLPIVAVT